MCRAIQHPVRGLFLRSYLAQISRDKLPDIGSEYEGDVNTVTDAVEFVLQNFMEMNKLWVRMQHQGPAREKDKREKERSELRDLVGKNLHVLSQIEGVDLDMYKETVLPRVLEQVVNCKDELAQYYLMDCTIQVFPDEYHLQTLETLLGACSQLQPTVDMRTVLSQLMDRLSNYAASSAEALPEFLQVEAFAKLSSAIGKLVRRLQSQDGDLAGEELPATPKKIFQILHQTIEALSSVPSPELALRLHLQCAEAANDCDLEPAAYEFFTQAFILYEEEVADSKAQVTALHLIMGTLQRMNVFGVENRDTLTHKATRVVLYLKFLFYNSKSSCDYLFCSVFFFTYNFLEQYSAKLLRKPDQCRAVYGCSHLFWVDDQVGIKDGERVLLCLKRALRIANAAQQMASATWGISGPVSLFIEILNKYLYFFEKGNPQITSSVIQDLIELIKTEMHNDNSPSDPSADAFFASTLRYIHFQEQKGGAMGEKYEPIKA